MSRLFALIVLLFCTTASAQTIIQPTCTIAGGTITCPSGSLTPSAGSGTVTSVSVTTQNGVSAIVTNPTTTPALAFTLGAITPSSVAIGGATIGSNALAATGTAAVSGTITGGAFIPTSSSAPSDGMYLNSAGQTAFSAGSTRIFFFNSAGLLMNNASGATLTSTAATAIAPTVIPLRSDSGTGMGSAGSGKISLISTSVEQLRINNGSIYVGGASSGADTAAVAPTISGALSTGTATNPDLILQTGVKTTSGSSQATATTAITIKGETQAVQVPVSISIGAGSAITSSGAGGNLTALAYTSPGTGVATALGINVGSAGAFVVFNGAGGTPSSLTGTNITGTAAGLTAGSVTTNANLTGDVTSSGNATTLAHGSASNLDSGTLASARGGAGAINGALKGNGSGVVSQAACADLSNATTSCSTANTSANTVSTLVARDGSGNFSATSITLSSQLSANTGSFTSYFNTPLMFGGSGTTGTQMTLQTTSGNGTTDAFAFVGGNNGGTTFATLSNAAFTMNSQQFNPNMATDAATADSTVCVATTGGKLLKGTGTLGICLGTSGAQFKTAFSPMTAGIDEIMRLKLINYRYLSGYGDGGARVQYGLTAQDVDGVFPDLVGRDANGTPINFDLGAFLPMSLHALQQLAARVQALEMAKR